MTTASPATSHSAIQTQIQQLYVAYFNRPADTAGLQYWTDVVEKQGAPLSTVSGVFATTTEYQDTYRGMNNAEVVNQVYMNLFGRAAEAEGQAYWTDLLDRHAITIDNVVTTVAAGARGSDNVAYRNKVTAASTFTSAALGDAAKALGYTGDAANRVLKDFLSAITDDDSLARHTLPDELDYLFDQIIPIQFGSAPHMLTSGPDSLIGSGSKVDHFLAVETGSKALFGADDVLDGGAGIDTFTLVSPGASAYIAPAAAKVSNIENITLTSNGSATVDSSGWTGVRNLLVTSKGGATLHSSTSASVTASDSALGTGSVSVDGGSSVTVSVRDAQFGTSGVAIGHSAAPTGKIVLDYAASAVTGATGNGLIEVNGGTAILINQSVGNRPGGSAVDAPIHVIGGLNTSSVVINNAAAKVSNGNAGGVQTNLVTISDAHSASHTEGSLHTVVVNNYSNLSITANALVTLGLGGGSGDVSIVNGGLAGNSHHSLALSLNSIIGGQISDAGLVTTLNLTTSGSDSSLANLNMAALADINLSGSAHLNLASTSGLSSIANVKISDKAGISGNFSAASVKSFDAAGTSGNNIVTIDISRTDYHGGSGADIVTLVGSNASHSVSLGSGADRVLLQTAGTNLNTYATVQDAHKGVAIGFADLGNETFAVAKIEAAASATFRDLANAAIAQGGNATANGALAWFQFGNDTYLVESRHNGTSSGFVDGVDMIIKLTGAVDLSHAALVNGVLVLG
jgi:S-layer protein